MAENENTTPEAAPQEEAPQFAVQRIYLKDASLEMPNAPEIFLAPEAPQVDIQLDVSEHGLAQPDLYEVVVRATVTAKTKINNEDRTVFLVECKQAGIFLLKGSRKNIRPWFLASPARPQFTRTSAAMSPIF